jgi:cytochrome bd-type quinol oxidase subunit 1
MIGAGTLMIMLTALLLWRSRNGRLLQRRRLLALMLPAAALPFVANARCASSPARRCATCESAVDY